MPLARWTASADALWLERSVGSSVLLGFTAYNFASHAPPAEPIIDLYSNDVFFPLQTGVRLQIAGRISDRASIEATYWGLQQWSIGGTIYGDPDGQTVLATSPWLQTPALIGGLDDFLGFAYSSRVDNAEINLKGALAQRDASRQQLDELKNGARREDVAQARAREMEQVASEKLVTAGSRVEDIRVAEAQVKVAQGKLDQIQNMIDELTIRAPVAETKDWSARVEALDLRPGDIVAPSSTVGVLLEDGQLYVRIYVPETQLGHIHVGQEVPITVDSVNVDRPTLITLGVQVLLSGDANRNATGTLQYRVSGTSTYADAPPLHRAKSHAPEPKGHARPSVAQAAPSEGGVRCHAPEEQVNASGQPSLVAKLQTRPISWQSPPSAGGIGGQSASQQVGQSQPGTPLEPCVPPGGPSSTTFTAHEAASSTHARSVNPAATSAVVASCSPASPSRRVCAAASARSRPTPGRSASGRATSRTPRSPNTRSTTTAAMIASPSAPARKASGRAQRLSGHHGSRTKKRTSSAVMSKTRSTTAVAAIWSGGAPVRRLRTRIRGTSPVRAGRTAR